MRDLIWKSVLLIGTTSFLGIACSDDDPEPGPDTGPKVECEGTRCTVESGNFVKQDLTFTAGNTYFLDGKVFIGDGTAAGKSTLTIQPGTRIEANASTKGYLAILPYSKIFAKGTRDRPIVFTSDAGAGNRKRGDWGGIIISGNAPVNCGGAAKTCNGEGDTGAYGGDDVMDSSGELEYVRVEFGGNQVNPTDELNGIAFQGVGKGTKVSYIHVHKSADDGVEFFGGTVDVDHLLITGIGDDSVDWTFGWNGRASNVLVQQHDDDSDNGIEADNNADQPNAAPRSNPTIENITLIGSPNSSKSDIGVLLRAGTGGTIRNAIIAHFNDACVDIDDAATFTHGGTDAGAPNGNLKLENAVIWCPNGKHIKEKTSDSTGDDGTLLPKDPWSVETWVMAQSGNIVADPNLADPLNLAAPNFAASAAEAAGKGGAGDGTWYQGWTAFPAN